jgi:outer membrane protein assembly factor BamB
MNKHNIRYAFVICTATLTLVVSGALAADWTQFRGPTGTFVADDSQLPTAWSITDGTNVPWAVTLPGRGVASPIVVDGRVIVTCSSGPKRDRLHVVAYAADDGRQLWHRRFWATGRSLCHPTSANAAPTPASDGERVFAFFSSNDLVCLDLDGRVEWIRGLALDHPKAGNDIGMSSSPLVVGDKVIVQSESQGNSFVEAIDTASGATRWQIDRPRDANWCSPLSIRWKTDGAPFAAVLLQSSGGIDICSADDGQRVTGWQGECNVIPSSVLNEFLFVPSNGLTVLSVDPPHAPEVVWQENRLGPGTPSPVVRDGKVYVISGAVVSCGDLESRAVAWRKRLAGDFWATPVLVGDHLYCVNRDGRVFVVDITDQGNVVGENELGEEINATPAVANGGLYIRSHEHLWKIAGADRRTAGL